MSSLSPSPTLQSRLLAQLADRRARLECSIAELNRPADLMRLLHQVDAALSQTEAGLSAAATSVIWRSANPT